MAILAHVYQFPVGVVMPPAYTLPLSIDPKDEASVRAFMESCALAWHECVRQRRLTGCCETCGCVLLHGRCDDESCPGPLPTLAPSSITDPRR